MVYRLEEPEFEDRWTPVVCKVISPSEIFVKIQFFGKVAYSHQRYGKVVGRPPRLPPQWCPVTTPHESCIPASFAASVGSGEVDRLIAEAVPAILSKMEE